MLDRVRSDLAWRLLRDGYTALEGVRRRSGGDDVYAANLLGRRTVVVRGEEGARFFYDEDVVARSGAVPPPLAWLLFGRGAVHGTDGDTHRRRKAMFLDLLQAERTEPLVTSVRARLTDRMPAWEQGATVFDDLVQVYGGAVLSWAGIRLDDAEAAHISRRLAEIVGGFGFAGTTYLRGWRSRITLERWARRLVRDTRSGSLLVPRDRPLALIADHRELDERLAAVELLNILRPTVAVAWPATMAVAELLQRPDRELVAASPQALASFVHECRRLQPFVPALAGRARHDTTIAGVEVRRGGRILLDVTGTLTDPHSWSPEAGDRSGPTTFDAGRFLEREPSPYDLVPQGGGDPRTGHRCPGEPLTVRMLRTTLEVVAASDLRAASVGEPDLSRIPTLPEPALRVSRIPRDASRSRGYSTDDGGGDT